MALTTALSAAAAPTSCIALAGVFVGLTSRCMMWWLS